MSSLTSESSESSSLDPCKTHFIAGFSEASGPRYRKIALNGLPKPDGKPQGKAETDEEKEETYIDAMDLALRHDTSDIYIPLVGDELPFSVKRSIVHEVWSTHPGLKPQERRDRPFGCGWVSGLTANIQFTWQQLNSPTDPVCESDQPDPDYTFVTDENGSVFRFVLIWRHQDGQLPEPYFMPIPSNRSEQDNFLASLEVLNPSDPFGSWNYRFKKKYGTTLDFVATNIVQSFQLNVGSSAPPEYQFYYYARLSKITDRYGRYVTYFGGPDSLIPANIQAQDGRQITVFSDGDRIIKITDPRTQDIQFHYTTEEVIVDGQLFELTLLERVEKPEGVSTEYSYQHAVQFDNTPKPKGSTQDYYFLHCNLRTVTDGKGYTHTFTYQFDNSRLNVTDKPGNAVWYIVPGLPRIISRVDLPLPGKYSAYTPSSIPLNIRYVQGVVKLQGHRASAVRDAEGHVRTYFFDTPDLINAQEFEEFFFGTDTVERRYFFLIRWKRMRLVHPTNVTETFEFNPEAAMALSSVVDYSGNLTTYHYDDAWSAAELFPWMPQSLLESPLFYSFYGDPTRQMRYYLPTEPFLKKFEYQNISDPNDPTKIRIYRVMSKITDEEGRTTTYGIDPVYGLRTSEIIREFDPLGPGPISRETLFAYNDPLFAAFMTERRIVDGTTGGDLVVTYTSDGVRGYLQEENVGEIAVTLYEYDPNGNRTSMTDPNLKTTTFTYDGLNRLTQTLHPDTTTLIIGYDYNSNKTSEEDENQNVTTYLYDELNRVTEKRRHMVSEPDLVTTYTYNAVNSKLSETDPRTYTTYFDYDSIQRQTTVTDPLNQVWIKDYSGPNSGSSVFSISDFKPTTVTNPRGFRTVYNYDSLYRTTHTAVEYEVDVFSLTEKIYDKVGNVTQVRDPLNHLTTTDYDAQNRPIKITFADNTFTETVYTSANLVIEEKDEAGSVTTHEYDAAGRRVKTYQPDPDTGLKTVNSPLIQMGYDDAGNQTSLINPRNYEWNYYYDDRNRRTEEHQPAVANAEKPGSPMERPVIITAYDGVGNVTAKTDARGNSTFTEYDRANRPFHVGFPPVPVFGSPTPVFSETFTTYDPNGNVLTVQDEEGHFTTNTYDELNRLHTTKTSPEPGNASADIIVTFEYDEVGNRTLIIDGRNLVTKFEYDGMNRLTKTHHDFGTPAAAVITDIYDELNKTDHEDAEGRVTKYLYDLRNRLGDVMYIGSIVDNLEYTYNAVGQVTAVIHPNESGSKRDVFYTYDKLRRLLTETSAGVTQEYTYDEAGNRLTTTYGGTGRILTNTYDALNRIETITDTGT